jgi:hypothetical protein
MNLFKLILCWLFLLPRVNFLYGQSDSSHSIRYYEMKSCKLTYRFFDGIHEGSKIVIFDDSGVYEKQIVVAHLANDSILRDSILGRIIKKDLNFLAIKTPQSTYSIDMDSKTGAKRDLILLPFDNDSFLGRRNAIGSDTILGRACEIVEYAKAIKVWYWKNIALKKEMVVDGIVMQEYATSIDEQYSINKDEFAVPKGVNFRVQ